MIKNQKYYFEIGRKYADNTGPEICSLALEGGLGNIWKCAFNTENNILAFWCMNFMEPAAFQLKTTFDKCEEFIDAFKDAHDLKVMPRNLLGNKKPTNRKA